jgi:hypothetical protein
MQLVAAALAFHVVRACCSSIASSLALFDAHSIASIDALSSAFVRAHSSQPVKTRIMVSMFCCALKAPFVATGIRWRCPHRCQPPHTIRTHEQVHDFQPKLTTTRQGNSSWQPNERPLTASPGDPLGAMWCPGIPAALLPACSERLLRKGAEGMRQVETCKTADKQITDYPNRPLIHHLADLWYSGAPFPSIPSDSLERRLTRTATGYKRGTLQPASTG